MVQWMMYDHVAIENEKVYDMEKIHNLILKVVNISDEGKTLLWKERKS